MPKMRWHPETGEPSVFADDEEPPAHFLDYHPDDEARATPAEPVPEPIKPLTKTEVTDALTTGKIEFDKSAKTPVLTALLVTNLKAALAAANKPFAEDDAPRTLLELVTGKTSQ